MKPDFKYDNSVQTAKPGYLHRKWTRLYPGWNKPPKPRPVIHLPRRVLVAA